MARPRNRRPATSLSKRVSLPRHSGLWVQALLGELPEAESFATCADCAMLPAEGVLYQIGSGHFNPATKCCTFVPRLPNFLVGGLLSDPDEALAHGRQRLEARIAAGLGVTPYGLRETSREQSLLLLGEAGFGHAQALRCPYLDAARGGSCSVWKYHNAYCATWFCKHKRGAVGWRFWTALRDYLKAAESMLARHCMVALELPAETLAATLKALGRPREHILPSELEGFESKDVQKQLWGAWGGVRRITTARARRSWPGWSPPISSASAARP